MNENPLRADSTELKMLLPEYLARIGCRPDYRDHRREQLSATCPLHNDQSPSLTAKRNGNVWEWYCFPCAVGGTVLELHALRQKLDARTQFPQICSEVAQILRGIPVPNSQPEHPTIRDSNMNQPAITKYDLAVLTHQWRMVLRDDANLRCHFAKELGLPDSVLMWAATWPGDGVGIVPAGFKLSASNGRVFTMKESRLVYIGEGHFKIRSPFGIGANPRFWLLGQQQRPWLGNLLVPGDTTVKHVHFHESESSALALIAAGAWSRDNSEIVVATSGSGGFKPEWIPMFAGRIIHMWPDADEAGKRFAETTAALLYPTVTKIIFHDWEANLDTSKNAIVGAHL